MSISKNTVDRCAFSSQVKFVYSLLILQGGPETYRVGVYKSLSLCRHCCNLAEGGCLLWRFHFTRSRYFLGHVAYRNLPWQGFFKS